MRKDVQNTEEAVQAVVTAYPSTETNGAIALTYEEKQARVSEITQAWHESGYTLLDGWKHNTYKCMDPDCRNKKNEPFEAHPFHVMSVGDKEIYALWASVDESGNPIVLCQVHSVGFRGGNGAYTAPLGKVLSRLEELEREKQKKNDPIQQQLDEAMNQTVPCVNCVGQKGRKMIRLGDAYVVSDKALFHAQLQPGCSRKIRIMVSQVKVRVFSAPWSMLNINGQKIEMAPCICDQHAQELLQSAKEAGMTQIKVDGKNVDLVIPARLIFAARLRGMERRAQREGRSFMARTNS